ncbi:MAG: LysR family transcriptional regulator [Rhodocyclales bacterium]|jgi:DNA-binding transcriptional LysR family regulator|nr:LysR family transcriptional regulator [Rhodocyclales bacterium]
MISRKYHYLIALAREKHFGRAAAACHVSPSTLSAAIRDLETELGVAVVERGKQFAGLTPEGRSVVEYAQRMAASAESLKQELATLRDGLTGRLRLGVIPTALTVVAALTASFARRHSLVTAEVLSLATDEILARLRNFELDAGIVYVESARAAGFSVVPVWRERHVLLTGADGRFAGRETISWAEAATVPLCLLTPDMQNRKTIDAVFAKVGAGVTAMLETNSIVSILAHVGSGHWSSIVPRSVLEQVGTPPGVIAIELVEPSVDWATGLVTLAREPQAPMVAALIAEAKALAESFEKPA